jgi:hypothetical protein
MVFSDAIEAPTQLIWYALVLAMVMFLILMIFLPDSNFLVDKILSIFRAGG